MLEILVVDDEKDICWALEKGLADEGVQVTQVYRGDEALREMRGRSFHAAIVDAKLPGVSGVEVSRALRRIAPRLPILLISGYHYAEDAPIQEGIENGDYQGFISKPFDIDEVLALLSRVIREGQKSLSPEPVNGREGQTERR